MKKGELDRDDGFGGFMADFIEENFETSSDFASFMAGYFSTKATCEAKSVAREMQSNCGHVYFITDGELVKIGKTKNNPSLRLRALGTGNINVKLLGFIVTENMNDLEKQLHSTLKNKRVKGEWFNISKSKAMALIKLHS